MPANNKKLEILKLRKITIGKHEIEGAFVSNIEIYESLTQPGITGYIDIKDYQALQEVGHVFADDDVIITLGIDGEENKELNLKFKVFTNDGSRQLALNTYDFLRIGFCSAWMVDALGRLLSKPFENMLVSDIIADLLTECGAKIGYIEPTKTKLENFVSPLWTPYHSIKYLMGYAINSSDIGGYVCWTDLKTGDVNVTTLDYMLKGTLGTYKSFEINSSNLRYTGRVKEMIIETSYDSIRLINTGLPNVKYHAFNFDTNKIVSTKNSMTDDKQTRLGTKFPLLSKYNSPKYTTHRYTPLFPETADPITKDITKLTDLLTGLESNTYSMLMTDVFKINIETLGELNRRVGWLAQLEYPSVGVDSGDKTGQRQMKGLYLIREIKHVFSLSQDYSQYITLVSDGFKEFDADLIKIGKG
jgi:hypothetical protein